MTLRSIAAKLSKKLNLRRPYVGISSAEDLAKLLKGIPYSNKVKEDFYKNGFHLIPRHYYVPIPEEEDWEFANKTTEMIGIDLNEKKSLNYFEKELLPYTEEFQKRYPLHDDGKTNFFLINGSYMAVDAHLYYSFIRKTKPQRIVEIGGGNSTRLAVDALKLNEAETGVRGRLQAIEPFVGDAYREYSKGNFELIEEKVQKISPSFFRELEAGDLLFIDSTHAVRLGGDVIHEYCEILPRLKPGVLVHIHDICLPKPYPRVYWDNNWYWTEQQMLQTFLVNNAKIEIVWAGGYLYDRNPTLLEKWMPEIKNMRKLFPSAEPSSFWFKTK